MNEIEKNQQELYKWSKPEKHDSKLNSKIKESDNIQLIHQWLRKIEDVSEAAINQTLNTKPQNKSLNKHSKSNICLNACEKKKAAQIKHDPYTDAHDLINEWMTDKIRLDLDDDFYDYVNITEVNKFSNSEKFLNELRAELLDKKDSSLDIKGIDYDKYDENYIAKDFLNNIMKKNIVDAKKLIYMDNHKPKSKDYRLQIEMRHQAVKENREKRSKEIEDRRKENLKRKEIEYEARQMVLKEENEKKMRENLEKQLIEQEAEKIRAEIKEKRKKDEEKKKELLETIREQEKKDLLELKKNIDIDQSKNFIDLKRKEIAEKRANDLADSLIKTRQLRLQQKTISAWYGMILNLRLKSGKAKALSDWKTSYKAFNGWKKLVITERLRREQQNHQNEIRNENLINKKAVDFYQKTLKEKYFENWKKYIKNELLKKKINDDKKNVKCRIQHFLEAAKDDTLSQVDDTESNYNGYTTNRTINSVVSNLPKRPRSRINLSKKKTHQQLSNEQEIKEFENFQAKQPPVDYEKKVKNLLKPWLKNQTAEIFDNRFKAQEKILNEQSKMIKEQKRMIEDLKFQQNQLAFKEQISLLEEIKARQIELEKLQKAEYAQERKLLKIKSQVKKNEVKENNGTQRETDEENSDKKSSVEDKIETERSVKQTFNKIAIKMDERAKMREQLKKEREEKRKQAERQKLEIMRAQEEEKIKIEEEERRKKMEELQEKKKIQKLLEEKKNSQIQKEKEQNLKADEFYRKYLLRFYGLNGFKKNIEQRDKKYALADGHYRNKIMKLIFVDWNILIKGSVIVKQKKADLFYQKFLLKNTFFNGLKQFKQSLLIGNAKATRFYNYNIKVKLFHNWQIYIAGEREKAKRYEILIAEHNLLRITAKYFKMFREYPDEAKKFRARQKRLDQLRNKVKELIPDYQGKEITNQ